MTEPSTTTSPTSLGGFARVERTTRRERVLDALRDAVSSGRLPAGTHLAEVELSENLGVSRGTLREALRHLQEEGLLVPDARGRLRVRVLAPGEVRDVFAVRGALEVLAATTVCGLADRSAVIAALREHLAGMADPGAAFEDLVREDLAFHEALCRGSGNDALLASWRGVGGLARAAVTAAGPRTALANMAAERHAPLVEHLERGDAATASAFLLAHLLEACELVVARMGRHT